MEDFNTACCSSSTRSLDEHPSTSTSLCRAPPPSDKLDTTKHTTCISLHGKDCGICTLQRLFCGTTPPPIPSVPSYSRLRLQIPTIGRSVIQSQGGDAWSSRNKPCCTHTSWSTFSITRHYCFCCYLPQPRLVLINQGKRNSIRAAAAPFHLQTRRTRPHNT